MSAPGGANEPSRREERLLGRAGCHGSASVCRLCGMVDWLGLFDVHSLGCSWLGAFVPGSMPDSVRPWTRSSTRPGRNRRGQRSGSNGPAARTVRSSSSVAADASSSPGPEPGRQGWSSAASLQRAWPRVAPMGRVGRVCNSTQVGAPGSPDRWPQAPRTSPHCQNHCHTWPNWPDTSEPVGRPNSVSPPRRA